ncbi:DnaJ C-terminal domain-containing protein [Roseateles sp.]|uniref:DnaJ C-terminal domain-containing protein n=1 Tax=Roseateles sp. TaxID=1971397 RepID=UPI003BAA9677
MRFAAVRFEDYYQVLGLAADADAPAIKQAYRRLARLHHPDINPTTPAHAAMARVNEAYEVLSDPQRRAAYDGVRRRQLKAGQLSDGQPGAAREMPGDWQQGFQFDGEPTAGRRGEGEGFTDFFTSMFGRAAQAEPADAKPARGADEHVRLVIDDADSVAGAVRAVTVRTLAPDENGRRAVALRQVQVQIPKGIQAGQHIRLPGQGSAGRGGAAAGDLYLEIQFKQHGADPTDSRDVRDRLPLAPWEAALGAEVATTTPGGRVSVSVPPDTPHGKRLRLRGQGLKGEPAGDLVLEVAVVLPPSTLAGARQAYESMAATLETRFQPRAAADDASHGR